MLLTEEQASKVFAGSYESRISDLAHACARNGWSLVSSSEDAVHFLSEGQLYKGHYKVEAGEYIFTRKALVQTLPESDAVGIVAGKINEMASALMSGQPLNKDALVTLSRHAQGYMSPAKALEALGAPALTAFYEENRDAVRKGVHGQLGDLESTYKPTNYSRMSKARAEAHRDEIIATLKSCAEALDTLEYTGESKTSAILAEYKESAIRAAAIARHAGLPIGALAQAADDFTKSLLTANIVRAYTQQEGK